MAERKFQIVTRQFTTDRMAPPVDKSGGGGNDGGMEERIKKLEQLSEKTNERLTSLDKDVAVMRSNYATKADISEAKVAIIVWVVGAVFLAQLLPALPGIITSVKSLLAK
ncbi:hypothetical protein G5S34_17520 [Herbaspirillum frisingense]|uniref:hypothetical protein n=1 Tax=Herbaspirillum frisingense TaxID=92645 RepID=UPI0016031995|nr:hypothetical protein [Herbaspirillum frisingense]QNB08373.1 hypothetical protein G5S34_17520 [Herbaspirillum frisingense]